jgi:hypothetical protein
MTTRSEIERVLDRYLAEGVEQVPDRVIDAALDEIDSTSQRRAVRLPWWFNQAPSFLKLAVGGAALIAVLVVGGMFLTRGPAPSVGGPGAATPSPTASPSSSVTLRMTERFESELYGYSIGHPADWTVQPGSELWSPTEDKEEAFDRISLGQSLSFRAGSAVLPDGVSADEWIMQHLTETRYLPCGPPRSTLEAVLIDGRPGRLRDSCGEVEATVVVGDRVYLFTYFLGSREDPEPSGGRPVFDAFAATIRLTPETAERPASPTP